ncbi:hypothetical protein BASA81_008553 [Batrachochytrium salamandrivorans]|nr:hypothetical protein BASA81_008553 [Batrachochytrium salamandrivorans]
MLSRRTTLVLLAVLALLFKRFRILDVYREQKRRQALLMRLPGPGFGPDEEHWLFGHLAKRGHIVHKGESFFDSEHLNKVVLLRLQQLLKKYEDGGMVRMMLLNSRIPLGVGSHVIISDMDFAREMLSHTASEQHWHKGMAYEVSKPLIGNSILSTSGEEWRSQRPVVEQAMTHMMQSPTTMDRVVRAADSLVQKWSTISPGEAVVVPQDCLRLTMDVIGQAAFSHNFHSVSPTAAGEGKHEAPLYSPFQTILYTLNSRCQRIPEHFLRFLPTSTNLGFNRAMEMLETQVELLLSHRRGEGNGNRNGDRGDLLDVLMEGNLSPQLVRENVQTMLFAGHDTTGAALTWALWLLAQHPDKMQRLREEILTKFGSTGSPQTDGELEQLPYLNAVVLETLRLYPSAAFTRMSDHDVVLGGKHVIPAGTEVLIAPYFFHRDPRYWSNPDNFQPERFVDEEMLSKGGGAANSLQSRIGRISAKQAYFPFSLGPRNCVGRALALMELRVVLVRVLQRFTFTVPSQDQDKSFSPVFALTLNPPEEIRLVPRVA